MIFKLNEEHVKRFKAWRDQLGSGGHDSFGSRFMFQFIPSGIGDTVKVVELGTKRSLISLITTTKRNIKK